MRISFQADADLNQEIVASVIRRQPQIDFQDANQACLEGLRDLEVLAQAAKEHRILVSHDKKTLPHYFAEFLETTQSPGVLIVPQRKVLIALVVEQLIMIWAASDASEWHNCICHLPF